MSAKHDLINALRLRATELGALVSCKPSQGRNVEIRQSENAMSERKIAEQLGLPNTVLIMGRSKWVLFATPCAHNALATALNRLFC